MTWDVAPNLHVKCEICIGHKWMQANWRRRGVEELVATYHITTATNFSWYKSGQEIQRILWKMIQNNGILELLMGRSIKEFPYLIYILP